MLTLKPFIRIIVLSFILATLLIILGVKYHWANYFKKNSASQISLTIPEKPISETKSVIETNASEQYSPELINNDNQNSFLASMNLEQMTEQCENLLSKQLEDEMLLEIAIANCVVSNYEETFQNSNNDQVSNSKKTQEELSLIRKCKPQFVNNAGYSFIEKELLIGICVSDNLNRTQ